jgi:hypothetical protein
MRRGETRNGRRRERYTPPTRRPPRRSTAPQCLKMFDVYNAQQTLALTRPNDLLMRLVRIVLCGAVYVMCFLYDSDNDIC